MSTACAVCRADTTGLHLCNVHIKYLEEGLGEVPEGLRRRVLDPPIGVRVGGALEGRRQPERDEQARDHAPVRLPMTPSRGLEAVA